MILGVARSHYICVYYHERRIWITIEKAALGKFINFICRMAACAKLGRYIAISSISSISTDAILDSLIYEDTIPNARLFKLFSRVT